jgi:hypothetical protein
MNEQFITRTMGKQCLKVHGNKSFIRKRIIVQNRIEKLL